MFHLDLPLRLAASGGLASVEAGSAKDVANSVGVLAATNVGERLSVPAYGTPDPVFTGVDAPALLGAIGAWEPRADPTKLQVDQDADGVVTVTMTAGG